MVHMGLYCGRACHAVVAQIPHNANSLELGVIAMLQCVLPVGAVVLHTASNWFPSKYSCINCMYCVFSTKVHKDKPVGPNVTLKKLQLQQ